MAETSRIGKIVEKAVSEVLGSHLPQLQQELVLRVLEEVQPKKGQLTDSGAEDLLKAITLIHGGITQKEILRALLDSTGHYCGRAALFV